MFLRAKKSFGLSCCLMGLPIVCVPASAHAQNQEAQSQEATGMQVVAPPESFMVHAIDVVGVTKLSAAEIERTIYPFLGPGKTPADIEAARKAIQDAYVKIGYEATDVEVPPQPQEDFARGLVQIKVGEASVAKVKVSGSKYHSAAVLLKQLPSIRSGEPLNFKKLQSELAAANRFPDREVTPSFDGGEVPGEIDVELRVRDELPLHSSLELNNDNSPNTTALRLTGSTRHSNIWGQGHTLTAGFSLAPQRLSDSRAIFGSYSAPLIGTPWTINLNGYKSNTDIAALGGTNVLGNGYQVGVQAIYRLPFDRDYHAFRVGVDFKDFKQSIGLRGTTISDAPIRYIPLTLGYNAAIGRDKSALDLSLSTTFGLRVIKKIRCFDPTAPVCSLEDQFTNREVDSTENFAHVNLDLTHTYSFAGDWVTQTKFYGQFADSHLVSNEQFSVGGMSTVRGYFQSEAVGDRGIASSIELRAPSLATYIGKFVDDFRLFSFLEGGLASVIDPLPDVKSVFRIASFGGGLRIKLLGHFTGEVLVGVPILSTGETRNGDPRYSFSVKGEF
jgi:hemolysin activation/secretion protein